jgi:hypothetical protein
LKNLDIYFQNINRGRNKTNELYRTISANDYDMIMLLETNFDDTIFSEEIFDDRPCFQT